MHGDLSVVRHLHNKARSAQDLAGHLLIDVVVFDQQNAGTLDCCQLTFVQFFPVSDIQGLLTTLAVSHDFHHRVDELGAADWFGQHVVNAQVFGALDQVSRASPSL